VLATRVNLGFGAAAIEINPIVYMAALKMDAAEAVGILFERNRMQEEVEKMKSRKEKNGGGIGWDAFIRGRKGGSL